MIEQEWAVCLKQKKSWLWYILHQRRSDQCEQQRDDVVVVVYVPGLDMCVLEEQMSYVPMCKWLVDAVYNWI